MIYVNLASAYIAVNRVLEDIKEATDNDVEDDDNYYDDRRGTLGIAIDMIIPEKYLIKTHRHFTGSVLKSYDQTSYTIINWESHGTITNDVLKSGNRTDLIDAQCSVL